MSDEVIIRELVGLDQTMTIFPLYSQVSRLSEAAVCQRLSAMFAQSNYRCRSERGRDSTIPCPGEPRELMRHPRLTLLNAAMMLWAASCASSDVVWKLVTERRSTSRPRHLAPPAKMMPSA